MQNIIAGKFINARFILGILLCLFACYRAATTQFYYTSAGFNYSSAALILMFIFMGVLNIKQIDIDGVLKKHKPLQGIMILTIVALCLYSFINAVNKKEPPTLEEMYKIERTHHK